jgi:hypothetical protein
MVRMLHGNGVRLSDKKKNDKGSRLDDAHAHVHVLRNATQV